MTCILLILLVISIWSLQAQDYLISFAGEGASTTVDSVKVENLTKSTKVKIRGSDVLHLMGFVTGIETVKDVKAGKIIFYPNPMKDYSKMQFVLPEPGKTFITLYDLSGRKIVQIQDLLSKGQHTYRIQGVEEGIYFVKISSGRYSFCGRFISSVSQNRNAKIVYENTENTMVKPEKQSDSKGTYAETIMQYTTGDRLKLTGISSNYSTVKTDIPTSDKSISFNFIPCTDGDNNNYPTVKIGTQTWMAENLKTTKFNDGESIPLVTGSGEWNYLLTPGYCYYNNDSITYKNVYGVLYNANTITHGKLCPSGWHVPTENEWIILTDYLGGAIYLAGGKLKETGITHWTNPNYGATNETGFSALPGGERIGDGNFFGIKNYGNWWSTSIKFTNTHIYKSMYYIYPDVRSSSNGNDWGLSIRCLCD